MALAYVVDDLRTDQVLVSRLLESRTDLEVQCANDGLEALDMMDKRRPDLVLTDMQMPRLDGLQLSQEIRRRFPAVPVILMTAHGSEEVAAEALRIGASSYVPKRLLSRDLATTVERVLGIAAAERQFEKVFQCVSRSEYDFELSNDTDCIQPLIGFLRQDLKRINFCDETTMMRIGVAIDEAVCNAVHHGNLEVDSDLRNEGYDLYLEQINDRKQQKPYCDRHVSVHAEVTQTQAAYTIRDEGKGFDPEAIPDPTDPANLDKVSGRGLLLIRTFMDIVEFSDDGKRIRMVKYRD